MATWKERLPTEVAQLILCHATDAKSLQSLALSSSVFFRSFKGARSIILLAVLENEVGQVMIPHAQHMARSANLQIPLYSIEEEVQEILRESREANSTLWTLQEALELSRLRPHLEYFADRYAESICSAAKGGLTLIRQVEKDRIRCAFYRFQTYCNLFGLSGNTSNVRPDCQSRKEEFLDKLPPWEVEQLVSVHEYLLGILSEGECHPNRGCACADKCVAFNDVAEHDIELGELNVAWLGRSTNDLRYKEYFMSFGLEFLHKVDQTKDYDKRYALFAIKYDSDRDFLSASFEIESTIEEVDKPLKDFADNQIKGWFPASSLADTDDGPFEAWKWAYADCHFLYDLTEFVRLRKLGYVFLDADRLSSFFLNPGNAILWSMNWDEYFAEQTQLQLFQHKSFEKRSELWASGWRGWWSENDQSKMVWCTEWKGKGMS
ncbi:uncharacterized protein KY384_006244 [Bacidia gigantensis]|uniref:uncharacterized protein n=1 Tax=Bacidia gigantensis TaxID=2732470 RepID=UPI001D039241|nr:uncharacterized protein KY384_006244 [Bacidia gigantensis]KAG8529607.1 hypothetical protein KY384_006244 [Bacidia gigantensis]